MKKVDNESISKYERWRRVVQDCASAECKPTSDRYSPWAALSFALAYDVNCLRAWGPFLIGQVRNWLDLLDNGFKLAEPPFLGFSGQSEETFAV